MKMKKLMLAAAAIAASGAVAAEWQTPDQSKAPMATRPWKVVKDAAPSLVPSGQWKLVWHDEFDGDKLDTSKWCYRTNFWGIDAYWFARPEDHAVEVTNGVARLKLVKRPDGQIVSPQLQTGRLVWDDLGKNPDKNGLWPFPKREKSRFEHRFGYYECRCRLQKKRGWWSAFWMQAPGSGATLEPRNCGVEHDIMESFFPGEVISHAFLTRGYGADYRGFNAYRAPDDVDLKKYPVWKLDTEEFHTFGFLWEEDGYTCFVDGRRSGFKVGGGAGEDVSQVPEFLLVTTECKMFRSDRGTGKADPELEAAYLAGDDFVIDHVRVFDRVDIPGPEWARGDFHARNTITRHQFGRQFKDGNGLRSAFDIDPKNDYWTAELYVPYTYFATYPNAQIPTTSAGGRCWTGNISRWRIGAAGLPKAERPEGEKVEMQRLWTRGNWWNNDSAAFGLFKFVE